MDDTDERLRRARIDIRDALRIERKALRDEFADVEYYGNEPSETLASIVAELRGCLDEVDLGIIGEVAADTCAAMVSLDSAFLATGLSDAINEAADRLDDAAYICQRLDRPLLPDTDNEYVDKGSGDDEDDAVN